MCPHGRYKGVTQPKLRKEPMPGTKKITFSRINYLIVRKTSSFTLTVTGRNFICNAGVSGSVVYFGLTRHTQESCGAGTGGDMQMTVTIGRMKSQTPAR